MPHDELPELSREVERLRILHDVPGLAVGVIHGDNTYVAASGVTSATDPLPVTADTLFHIGSTSKTLTATALMAARQEGLVDLDDLVARHLPELRMADATALESLTVRMLLNHTAGFRGDSVADTGWGDDALALAVTESICQQPQIVFPGRIMSYNNAAFGLAGRLLEVVTGETFEAAVTRRVLEPLGMDSTFYLPWQAINRRLAVGHVLDLETGTPKPLHGWPMPRSGGPYGGAVSSVNDQLTYARFHLDGGAPLTEESRLGMQEPTVAVRSGISGVGISWLLKEQRGTRLVTHGGNVDNIQLSSFALVPRERLAVTTLGNSIGGREAGEAVLDWALERLGGLTADRPMATQPVSDEFAGRYDAGQWFQDVTFTDGKLFVGMVLHEETDATPEIRALFERPPVELVVVGEDLVAFAANPAAPVGDFIRNDDGSIGWFRLGLRLATLI